MDAWPAVQVNQADQQAHSFLMSRNEDYFDPRASLSRPCKKTILFGSPAQTDFRTYCQK
jgi:hypothetical protein